MTREEIDALAAENGQLRGELVALLRRHQQRSTEFELALQRNGQLSNELQVVLQRNEQLSAELQVALQRIAELENRRTKPPVIVKSNRRQQGDLSKPRKKRAAEHNKSRPCEKEASLVGNMLRLSDQSTLRPEQIAVMGSWATS